MRLAYCDINGRYQFDSPVDRIPVNVCDGYGFAQRHATQGEKRRASIYPGQLRSRFLDGGA